jgi:multidrug efflux pump subunit AcrA (membrane-fusion protein)
VEMVSVDKEYAVREATRLGRLQAEGAVALRELDRARARAAVLAKEEEAATSELVASQKQLREESSDAEADVDRARAAYRAAQQIQRQVARQGAPARVAAARQEIGARQSAAHAAAVLRQEKSLKSAEVQLKQLERDRVLSQIALVKKRIDQSCLIAHASGVVATPHLDQRLGRQFAVGEAVCVLDLTGQVQVRVFVDERDVGEITRGAPVQLKIAAFPDRLFAGQVREIVRRSLAANGRNSYEVRLRVLNPGGQLMPGMTGWAKIGCGQRSWGALLARRVLRYVRTEAWSWF